MSCASVPQRPRPLGVSARRCPAGRRPVSARSPGRSELLAAARSSRAQVPAPRQPADANRPLIPYSSVSQRTGELAVLCDPRAGCLGRLLLAVPAPAAARADRAAGGADRGVLDDWISARDHPFHDPPDTALHGAGRPAHAGAHGARVALAATARRPLPGRRRRAAHAEAVRALTAQIEAIGASPNAIAARRWRR